MLGFHQRKGKATATPKDPENPTLTEAELQRMRPVSRVRRLRQQLGLSQAGFAERFHLSLATVRDWEQGRTTPDRAAANFIALVEQEPDLVAEALERDAKREAELTQEREKLGKEARQAAEEA